MKMTVNNSDDYKALEKLIDEEFVSNILYTLAEIYIEKSNKTVPKLSNYYLKVGHKIEMVAKEFDESLI